MKTRKILGCALALAMITSLTTRIYANGWEQNEEGSIFYTDVTTGTKITGWYKDIDNCWYYFDEKGAMKTGWVNNANQWYYLGESGVMQTSAWATYKGDKYYLKGTGVMATDYIKDGYEFASNGKAILLSDSNAVVYDKDIDLTGITIEGNLYVNTNLYKEIELNKLEVGGKLVLLGDDERESNITIKDSNIESISTQSRNAEVVLAGDTKVKSIEMEENAAISSGVGYSGTVGSLDVKPTVKTAELQVNTAFEKVVVGNQQSITIKKPVGILQVNDKTNLTINANVKEITVNKEAKDTMITVEKGTTVGKIVSDTTVNVNGSGKVKVTIGEGINDESKHIKYEGNINYPGDKTAIVKNEEELRQYLVHESFNQVVLGNDIELNSKLIIDRSNIKINGKGHSLFLSYGALDNVGNLENTSKSVVEIKEASNIEIRDLKVNVMGDESSETMNDVSGIYIMNSSNIDLSGITATGAEIGINIIDSTATLAGTTDVSYNKQGGIAVSKGGETLSTSLALASGASITNKSEAYENPTLWTSGEVTLSGFEQFYKGLTNSDKITAYYRYKNHYVYRVSNEAELRTAISNTSINAIILTEDIELKNPIVIKYPITFDGNGKTISIDRSKLSADNLSAIVVATVSSIPKIENLTVKVNSETLYQSANVYGIQITYPAVAVLSNITVTGADVGILTSAQRIGLDGTIDVSNNRKCGIVLSQEESINVRLDLSSRFKIKNDTEAPNIPTMLFINVTEDSSTIINASEVRFNKKIEGSNTSYYLNEQFAKKETVVPPDEVTALAETEVTIPTEGKNDSNVFTTDSALPSISLEESTEE